MAGEEKDISVKSSINRLQEYYFNHFFLFSIDLLFLINIALSLIFFNFFSRGFFISIGILVKFSLQIHYTVFNLNLLFIF